MSVAIHPILQCYFDAWRNGAAGTPKILDLFDPSGRYEFVGRTTTLEFPDGSVKETDTVTGHEEIRLYWDQHPGEQSDIECGPSEWWEARTGDKRTVIIAKWFAKFLKKGSPRHLEGIMLFFVNADGKVSRFVESFESKPIPSY